MTTTLRRRTTRVLAPLACVAVAFSMTACGDDDDAAGSDAVTVADAWARTSASSQTVGAMYFVITGGAEDDTLTGASVSTDVAAEAQMHETVMAETEDTMMTEDTGMTEDTMSMDTMTDSTMDMGGSMTMQEVESVAIPAGETVSFEPGGYHIMLMELAAPLEAGNTFEAELSFEKAGTITVEVEVRDE